MPGPAGHNHRMYNAEERAVIDPFKSEYLNATTPAERKSIAQLQIFLKLFNHWHDNGEKFSEDEMKKRSGVSETFNFWG
jgi:hypothetical protein